MHDPHGVAAVNHTDNLATQACSGTLGVMPLGNDPIEELAALAEFHDQIDRVAILKGTFQFNNVPVAGEVVHDLDLAPDVLHVVAVEELAGGDGLAGQLLPDLVVGHQVRHSELASAQFPAEGIEGADVRHGPVQDPPQPPGGRGGCGGGARRKDRVWVCFWGIGNGGLGMGIWWPTGSVGWLAVAGGEAVAVAHSN